MSPRSPSAWELDRRCATPVQPWRPQWAPLSYLDTSAAEGQGQDMVEEGNALLLSKYDLLFPRRKTGLTVTQGP